MIETELALEALVQGLAVGFGFALVATVVAIAVMFWDGRKDR